MLHYVDSLYHHQTYYSFRQTPPRLSHLQLIKYYLLPSTSQITCVDRCNLILVQVPQLRHQRSSHLPAIRDLHSGGIDPLHGNAAVALGEAATSHGTQAECVHSLHRTAERKQPHSGKRMSHLPEQL